MVDMATGRQYPTTAYVCGWCIPGMAGEQSVSRSVGGLLEQGNEIHVIYPESTDQCDY